MSWRHNHFMDRRDFDKTNIRDLKEAIKDQMLREAGFEIATKHMEFVERLSDPYKEPPGIWFEAIFDLDDRLLFAQKRIKKLEMHLRALGREDLIK